MIFSLNHDPVDVFTQISEAVLRKYLCSERTKVLETSDLAPVRFRPSEVAPLALPSHPA